MRILLAEDEKGFSEAIAAVLEHHNYSVDMVFNGEDAFVYGLNNVYDVILLDIMLPKMDGLTVLKRLREKNVTTNVLLITAKAEVESRIEGLDAGADDYLPKPFVMGELLARIRALTRRRGGYTQMNPRLGNTELNRLDYTLVTENGSVRLGGKEFQIVEMLMSSPGQVITTEQFMTRIWGYDTDVEINVVWVNISNIRKKLAEIGSDVEIRAVRGVGYLIREE